MKRILLSLLFPLGCLAADSLIWIEGEDAAKNTTHKHPWYDSVVKEALSNSDWASHFSDKGPPELHYNIDIEKAGTYRLWLRANGSKISMKSGQADWTALDLSERRDRINIASDGGVDLRFVAWIKGPKLELPAGKHPLAFRLESGNNFHGGIDCFVLATGFFTPDGKLKPGEKLGLAHTNAWAFEPDHDPFSEEALVDFSTLNHKPAGRHGWVKNDRGDFRTGGGHIRFWAINTGHHQQTKDMDSLRNHARWLARRGVNMVRSHSQIWPKGEGPKLTDVDSGEIENIQRLVATMKAEGIYTTISPYWAIPCKRRDSFGLPDSEKTNNLSGQLFFVPELQAAYKGWVRELLTRPNPHADGKPLGEDPAVAIFQIQNEDSLLFWTIGSVQGEARQRLRRLFHDKLVEKYGSADKAIEAWDGDRHKNDSAANREFGLNHIWALTQPARGGRAKRLADQVEFYGRLMRDFNTEIARFLREDLDCPVLINAGNWKTADNGLLLDVERWSYDANEVIGVNRYFGGSHHNPSEGHKAGYMISKGDLYTNASALLDPRRFPLTIKPVAGKPFIISESSWVPPTRFQAEGPFLVAAYGQQTGCDIYYWFSTGGAQYGRPIGKWQCATPMIIGQFPAAASLFRRDLVRGGRSILHERRSLDDLWKRRRPLVAEGAGFDPNRDASELSVRSNVKTEIDPLASLVGRVQVEYDADPSKSKFESSYLKKGHDVARGVLSTTSNHLKWDYHDGVCILDAPQAQGACGFLGKRERVTTKDLVFACSNEYASVLAIALDREPLATSERVFVQIGTVVRPFGWHSKAVQSQVKGKPFTGRQILSLGSSPWNIERADIRFAIKNETLAHATVLDANFLKRESLPMRKGALRLPPDALYVLLTKEEP